MRTPTDSVTLIEISTAMAKVLAPFEGVERVHTQQAFAWVLDELNSTIGGHRLLADAILAQQDESLLNEGQVLVSDVAPTHYPTVVELPEPYIGPFYDGIDARCHSAASRALGISSQIVLFDGALYIVSADAMKTVEQEG